MMSRLTPVSKIIILALIGLGFYFGVTKLVLPLIGSDAAKSVTLGEMSLPTTTGSDGAIIATKQPEPTSDVSTINGFEFRTLVWFWNSQMGEIYANGGKVTTKGSLMERNGVRLKITRQDDVPQMMQELIKFANAYKSDPNTTQGTHFVQIMGDGAATFLASVNKELEKIGPEYKAVIIGSPGRSAGEDQLMADPSWKTDPKNAKGSLISTVVRDGDWNIVIKWAADNDIPVNTDETTYDPEAINFVNADNYIDAAQKYISGYSEDRILVVNGKKTVSQKVTVNAVSTWTPADVMVADKKGGLATIVSTKDYRNQMPNVIIGINKFCKDHNNDVVRLLTAIFEGSDQVKAYPEAAKIAAKLSAEVYGEQTGDYILKYYNGETRSDAKGVTVSLGGSKVMNLADNKRMYGLAEGSTNVYAAVYKLFGDKVVELYPTLVPSIPPVEDILDLSYLKQISSNVKTSELTSEDKPVFDSEASVSDVVSERQWNILFTTGKADFTPAAERQLAALKQDLLVAGNLRVVIEGHTDNTGAEPANEWLSNARAVAIKSYLEKSSSTEFGNGRIITYAYGSKKPIAPNTSPEGRAKNRRVTIKLVR